GKANSRGGVVGGEAKKPPQLKKTRRNRPDQIGGRVPGTPAMPKAVAWAKEAMREAGAESVHTEEFTMPVSWSEGPTLVEVVAPEKFPVRAVSIAWSPAIKGTLRAPVVDVGEGDAEGFAHVGQVAGSI